MPSWIERFLYVAVSASILKAATDVPKGLPEATFTIQHTADTYYWRTTEAGNSAALLTLFCKGCGTAASDVPVVAILRDSAGDLDSRASRLTYVWLLTYSPLNVRQRLLGAVPFFCWRIGPGPDSIGGEKVRPLMNLSAPAPAVVAGISRDLVQWTLLDGYGTPVRASTRAYQGNATDHERAHVVEAISHLRQAPVSEYGSALSKEELETVIARLELRKRLLGELVADSAASRLGEGEGFEEERVRSRNWELLRQCAEKTGLQFDSLQLASVNGEYGLLSIPAEGGSEPQGTTLGPVWKLLNIRDPWLDPKLKNIPAPTPLAVYSLDYPKMPLLLVDFRSSLRIRRREMTQRYINEVTSGVIGISHFTNWYYYVAADLYDFVSSRRGGAVDRAERLDCYSRFRMALAIDHNLDADLRAEMQARADAASINPLENQPGREMRLAEQRFEVLERESRNGILVRQVEQDQRAEMAKFGSSHKAQLTAAVLHGLTFGLYTRRVPANEVSADRLDAERRIQADLAFVNKVVDSGPRPEITFDSATVRAAIREIASLNARLQVASVRLASATAISRVAELSQDPALDAECFSALQVLRNEQNVLGPVLSSGLLSKAGE